jgi:transposase
MARYKLVDRSPRFLPIVLEAQLIPGSFEHALDILIDTEIDLSGLAKRFCNDETGAPAYDPAVMLKIVLLAYSRGVVAAVVLAVVVAYVNRLAYRRLKELEDA